MFTDKTYNSTPFSFPSSTDDLSYCLIWQKGLIDVMKYYKDSCVDPCSKNWQIPHDRSSFLLIVLIAAVIFNTSDLFPGNRLKVQMWADRTYMYLLINWQF